MDRGRLVPALLTSTWKAGRPDRKAATAARSDTSSTAASADPARRADGVGARLDLGRRPRRQRHRRPRLGKRRGQGQPDPPSRPGHQGAPAVQAEARGAREPHLGHGGERLDAAGIGHVAVAVAAHAHVGLLGMPGETFERA